MEQTNDTMRSRRPLAPCMTNTLLTYGIMGLSALAGPATILAQSAPPPEQASKPNIVIFLLDDVGFGQLSSFGGPIHTPNIDQVAAHGLRYNNFHTTALSSPSRAALLTGRNHHSVGMGVITEMQRDAPGYTSHLPKDKALFARTLQDNGYGTMGVGKWHDTPVDEVTTNGPYELWPTSLGFDHWYGFLAAETNQWHPILWDDKKPIDPSIGHPDYHMTVDMTDKSIAWLKNSNEKNPDKPFFLYYATGATHAPHHAPPEYIAKYKGEFDQGWDMVREETLVRQKSLGIVPLETELSPRPSQIPAWDDLSADQKLLYARMQEVFAGYLEHTDHEFGRLLATLRAMGKLDNTIIIITSDNGASGEGGPEGSVNEMRMANGMAENFATNLANIDKLGSQETYNHYPAGWSLAGNTPLKYWKQITHEGGIRDPFIISWPQLIKDQGSVRSSFTHMIDVAPTLFDLTGITPASVIDNVAQQPLEGVSFAATLADPHALTNKHVQYFEMIGNRAVWVDGWTAVTFRGRMPWLLLAKSTNPDFDHDVWELYDMKHDFSQVHDLAAQYPQKLAELKGIWQQEATKYNVFPLNDNLWLRTQFNVGRTEFTYHDGDVRIPEPLSPLVKNRSHSITALVDIPTAGADGMLVTCGGRFGGYGFFLQGGRLTYVHNFVGDQHYVITSNRPVPSGQVKLDMVYQKTGQSQGRVTLFINDEQVGVGTVEHATPLTYSLSETFDVGMDSGTPVIDSYQVPFRFTGQINSITFHLLKDDAEKFMPAPNQASADFMAD